MPILYEINQQYLAVMEQASAEAEGNEGVISDDTAAKLDAVELQRDEKIRNCIMYYKNENALADAIQAEADALKKRADRHHATAEWMKRLLAGTVQPGEKIEHTCGRIGWRKSSAIEIAVPIEQLPQQWIKISTSADKSGMKDYLKSGGTIDGCQIVEKTLIQIK